jgi:dTDP-4-dehydrorhamnose 3,5-epimerase
MQARGLAVPGSFEFTPQTYRDKRGLFVSPLQGAAFTEAVGHGFPVVQSNHTRSAKGVLRGIHFTTMPPGQAKYVYCAHGRALDVVVDVRAGSPAFGTWDSVELDSGSCRAVYLPVGVGHAFLALEENTVMCYLVSTSYRPGLEQSIDLFDRKLGLPWPKGTEFVISERDRAAISLAEAQEKGLLPEYADCLPTRGADTARGAGR